MNLLLDTHIFLWFITNDPKLPAAYALAIQDPANDVHLSTASVWEAVIKFALGKLPLPGPAPTYLPARRMSHGIASLPVEEGDMPHLATLPHHHRDPFDRIIISQTLRHGMTLLSVDQAVTQYAVPVLPPV
jgi:PIN domain nuclease of toxin-antitoxin system